MLSVAKERPHPTHRLLRYDSLLLRAAHPTHQYTAQCPRYTDISFGICGRRRAGNAGRACWMLTSQANIMEQISQEESEVNVTGVYYTNPSESQIVVAGITIPISLRRADIISLTT
jgi:hypothetical protein